MLQKKIKKILPIICSIIIGFSSMTVSASEVSDSVYSSSDISSFMSSSNFTSVSSLPIQFRSLMSAPAFNFTVPRKETSLNLDFNFDFSDIGISSYSSYNLVFPFIFGLTSPVSNFDFTSVRLYLKIIYADGSFSNFSAVPVLFEDLGKSYPVYYLTFDFILSGNKLNNISDSYFTFDFTSTSSNRSCYFGLVKGSSFTVSKYSADYNPLFSSSVNWVSDIFDLISSNFALFIFCIGFPVVCFGFLLLRKFIKN